MKNYLPEKVQMIVIPNNRGPQDAAFITSIALPATGTAAVYTPSLNIIQAENMSEHYYVQVDIPAIPSALLYTGYTLTVELQGATDNSTFTRVKEAADVVITGTTAATPAQNVIFRLSPDAPQYVRAAFTAGATIGGSLAGYTGFLSLRF